MGVPILGGWGGGLTTWEKFPRKVVFFWRTSLKKDVNKVVDEDNVVDKKLNEGTQLEDMVMMNVFIRFLLETAYKLKDTLE